ncbi:hypothetical protein CBOM_00230 [Ceraceosorus bombacis]|uniref:Uncharacterized protein n=1 Tax=Ceraceosorus bombacis TaxID=401625 RepID=A0A0P1B8N4_9BASI|nr:hypothetical protein CBOM_00230 [Ceraceosorus bombacis]
MRPSTSISATAPNTDEAAVALAQLLRAEIHRRTANAKAKAKAKTKANLGGSEITSPAQPSPAQITRDNKGQGLG